MSNWYKQSRQTIKAVYAKDIPTRKQYGEIAKDIATKAKENGLSASQYQAKIWIEKRGRSESFADTMAQWRLL